MDQYPGAERLGNNFYATPDLKNYETTLPSNKGPFAMDCILHKKGGQRKNNRKNSQKKNARKNGRKNKNNSNKN